MGTDLDPALDHLGTRVHSYWDEVGAYAAAQLDPDDADGVFRFLDGPPNPSGRTHLGTVWNKVLKDVCLRHARASGFAVTDVPGYDTHLFTTEQSIAEREGIRSPTDLEDGSLESFEGACETYEESHLEGMTEDFREFGVWMDWAEHYRTDADAYADSVWRTFRQLRDGGDLGRRTQVAYWCGDCRQARAKRSEVAPDHLPNREADAHEYRSIYLAYPLADEAASLATRATAPWHLLANQFLTVDPDAEYCRLSHPDHGDVYVAADRAAEVFPALDVSDRVEERVYGTSLAGATYERPIVEACAPDVEQSPRVYCREQNSAASEAAAPATGIGHGVPALDESDRQFARRNGVAVRDPVADDGTLADWRGRLAGREVGYHATGLADELVAWLREEGRLLRRGEADSWSECCWLCGSPVLHRPSRQWYVELADREGALRSAIDSVEWIPEDVGETMADPSNWHPDWSRDPRFEASEDALLDWLVEQRAYWGMPIPAWVSEDDPSDVVVVGSLAELAERADQSVDASELAPRRSVLDDLTITEDGTTYRRVDGVFADRFTAALAAVHVFGPPWEADGPSDWRTDLILEARDQPGLWFFMQLAIGVPTSGTMPFRTCYVHGFLTDEHGEKMSKSVGNVVTPDEALERHCVDAVRWFLVTNTAPTTDLSLDWDEVAEIEATFRRLLEAARTVDRLSGGSGAPGDGRATGERVLESWVDDELERIARESADAVSALAFDDAAGTVLTGVDQVVSRGYVPMLEDLRARRGGLSEPACDHAREALRIAARLLAPYAPHVAEVVYQRLDGPRPTVHAAEWPFDLAPAAEWGPSGRVRTPASADD